jgi:sulfate transport system ATP-binding protein
VRVELRRWLRRLHDEIGLTSVFVTHDQEEALEVSDRVVVMNRGRVEQVGTPEDVFERPASPFVMSFLGNASLFHDRKGEPAGYIRPHELELAREESGEAGVWATLVRVNAASALVKLELRDAGGRSLHAEMPREIYGSLRPLVGERLHVVPRNVRVFEEELAAAV